MSKHTPEPWEIRGPDSTGWEIYAHVPSLDRAVTIEQVPIRPTVSIGDDGKVYVCISYESWCQFPSDDWRKMQAANARLIKAAPRLLRTLRTIAFEPIGSPEASDADVLRSVVEITRVAISEIEEE